jgi:hypothetical protein
VECDLPSPYPLDHLRGNALRDLPYLAPQLQAAPFLEFEIMQLETCCRQPNLMFHANDFCVGDCFELGF